MIKFTKVRKMLMGLMVVGQLIAVPAVANAAPSKESVEVKKYDSLKAAAEDYAKVLQEISNYGSRQMLIDQFDVSVYKVNENGNEGEVVFLIKGYDENALNKYLGDNASKYVEKVDNSKDEIEVNIDKYIKLQYDYLTKTKKINLATSTVKFKKGSDNKWQVVK